MRLARRIIWRMAMIAAAAAVILSTARSASASSGQLSPAVADALTRPTSEALRIVDSLSRARNAPGAVRAQSLRILGDHQFAREDYKKAADFYQQAMRLDSSSIYRELYDVSMAMIPAPTPALVQTPPPAPVPTQQAVSAPTPPPAPVSTQQAASAPAAQNPSTPLFTIQVGAFGSRDNADNLVRRLTGKYRDITVSPTTSGDQKTLYRVRVGSFSRREDADTLVQKLTSDGLTARIVER
jgi:cell division septation protein DedD